MLLGYFARKSSERLSGFIQPIDSREADDQCRAGAFGADILPADGQIFLQRFDGLCEFSGGHQRRGLRQQHIRAQRTQCREIIFRNGIDGAGLLGPIGGDRCNLIVDRRAQIAQRGHRLVVALARLQRNRQHVAVGQRSGIVGRLIDDLQGADGAAEIAGANHGFGRLKTGHRGAATLLIVEDRRFLGGSFLGGNVRLSGRLFGGDVVVDFHRDFRLGVARRCLVGGDRLTGGSWLFGARLAGRRRFLRGLRLRRIRGSLGLRDVFRAGAACGLRRSFAR